MHVHSRMWWPHQQVRTTPECNILRKARTCVTWCVGASQGNGNEQDRLTERKIHRSRERRTVHPWVDTEVTGGCVDEEITSGFTADDRHGGEIWRRTGRHTDRWTEEKAWTCQRCALSGRCVCRGRLICIPLVKAARDSLPPSMVPICTTGQSQLSCPGRRLNGRKTGLHRLAKREEPL